MSQAAKRKRSANNASQFPIRPVPIRDSPVQRNLLEQYFRHVGTLREHALSQLPDTSRIRRKKIASLGLQDGSSDVEKRLAHLLDTTLVCADEKPLLKQDGPRDITWQQWLSFSQRGDESYVTISDGIASSLASQSEIIDFVIWLLFSREKKIGAWPKHILCDGFRRNAREGMQSRSTIPGLFSLYPNFNAQALREGSWPYLLALLGQSGEKVMINLLVECSVFVKVDAGLSNYYQISGFPLSEVDLSHTINAPVAKVAGATSKGLSDITPVRSRIFYAKPAITAKGLIQPGYKHIHALNRYPYVQEASIIQDKVNDDAKLIETRSRNKVNTLHLMMYIFPRQFGLHNAFTSDVNAMQTAQKIQDYTLREEEFARVMGVGKTMVERQAPKIPKRLRGSARDLVQRLQILHNRCSYLELLNHYCPRGSEASSRPKKASIKCESKMGFQLNHRPSASAIITPSALSTRKKFRRRHTNTQVLPVPQFNSVIDLASRRSHVTAFCQAVLSKIIPNEFWGTGNTGCHNKAIFLQKIDHFIKLRRFETLSMHEIAQGFKIADLAWLQPPGLGAHKSSQTDTQKRHELFYEFLFYVFDSLLIPLIRSNFYVTESNTHRYHVFYFRHDTWRSIADREISDIKASMFEELKLEDARRILDSRQLGFSQLRLLPKGGKLRPIMNLRRRNLSGGLAKVLGPSVNSVLGPVHSFLRLEKEINPAKLGSTLFSVGDIYSRLRSFKKSLDSSQQHTFYCAKIDVTAAFDTIPQAAVSELMRSIPSQGQYIMTKHTEMTPGERALVQLSTTTTKPIRRWYTTALAEGQCPALLKRLEGPLGSKKKNTVFVDSAMQRTQNVSSLLSLLVEHIEQNLVKVGKKYYRQKRGIPQGSVLSSFLCNYFYADLESHHLSFLNGPDCLLMRLIDDFLLITLDKSKAIKFVDTMHRGLPDYGVEVNCEKTLVNFDMPASGGGAHKVNNNRKFPYCGTLIDSQTLDITKDHQRGKNIDVSHSLTVDFGRVPGQAFQKKVLNSFKIQSHLMFYDTEHNSTDTVLQSLHDAFSETALKMWAYIRCLPTSQQPSSGLTIRTIAKVADVAFLILTSKSRKMRFPHYTCNIRKSHVTVVAYEAFVKVLSRKQTRFGHVLAWLRGEVNRLGSNK